jgi:hypothetical protein
VTGPDLLDEAGLMAHELELALRAQRTGFGEVHRGRSPARSILERTEQGLDELPVREVVHRGGLRGDSAEVRRQERVGHLHLSHRCRHDLLLHRLVDRFRLDGDDQFVGAELNAGRDEQVASQRAGCGGHRCIIRKQRNEARIARGSLREDARQPVESLLLVRPLGIRERPVGFDAGTLFAQQESCNLKSRAVGRLQGSLLHCGLDLPGGASEHGDDSDIISRARLSPLRI